MKKKNADMPAMPLNNSRHVTNPYDENRIEGSVGLTKRENFSVLMMASPSNPHNSHEHKLRADWAIAEADALLEALDND